MKWLRSLVTKLKQRVIGDPIKHVVVLMFENHSFDQMLGCFKTVDGVDQQLLLSGNGFGRRTARRRNGNLAASPHRAVLTCGPAGRLVTPPKPPPPPPQQTVSDEMRRSDGRPWIDHESFRQNFRMRGW